MLIVELIPVATSSIVTAATWSVWRERYAARMGLQAAGLLARQNMRVALQNLLLKLVAGGYVWLLELSIINLMR